jgi:ribose transport system substrate-binding protein
MIGAGSSGQKKIDARRGIRLTDIVRQLELAVEEEPMKRILLAGAAVALALAVAAGAGAQEKKQLAFVVNGASDFWKLAEAGVKKAQTELPNYELQFKYPEQAAAAIQQRLMDDLVAAGVDAIMVSAVDPKTSTEALNRVGGQVPLFTTDSDAPDSNRIAYIGSSNTDAGKQAGELVLKALPDGGKCMGFVGLPGADNARERIEGVKAAIQGSKVELVDVRGDDIDQTRAKRNVEDTLSANPDINCMIGFYSYNTPRIYEVLKEAGKLGEMKVIGFDEDPITLGGVREGTIIGTVVQQPYEWGYQGMKLMAKYLEGDKSVIPDNKLIIVPTKIIDQSNVDAFEAELKARISG